LFLVLLPLTLLLVVGLGHLASVDSSAPADAAREFGIRGAAATSVAKSADLSSKSQVVLLGVAAFGLLYASASAVRAVRLAHAIAWDLPERRWPGVPLATLGFLAVLVVGLGVASADVWAREHLGRGGLVVALATTAAIFVCWLVVAVRLPHRNAPLKAFVPGAVLMAVGFQALHLATVYWIAGKLARASATYGAHGTALVILLWLYLLGRLVVASAALSASLAGRTTPGGGERASK
jgi:membrane protein